MEKDNAAEAVGEPMMMAEFVAALAVELGIEGAESGGEIRRKVREELDRRLMPCGMEWPRFADGAKALIQDRFDVPGEDPGTIGAVEFKGLGTAVVADPSRELAVTLREGERLNRAWHDVMGFDGKPVEAGDEVYVDGLPEEPHPVVLVEGNLATVDIGSMYSCEGRFLSHEPFDTQERIIGDARKRAFAYWDCTSSLCSSCPSRIGGAKPFEHYGVSSCDKAMVFDLLHRTNELHARKARRLVMVRIPQATVRGGARWSS